MANETAGYAVSRTNATKFGVTTNGPRLCPGWGRCRLRWCEGGDAAGSACPVEQAVARSHEAHYRRVYDYPELRQQLEDFDRLLTRLVHNDLRRRRILFRLNQTWKARGEEGTKEFELADRYLAAALNEYQSILERLGRAQQNVHERLTEQRSRRNLMPMA